MNKYNEAVIQIFRSQRNVEYLKGQVWTWVMRELQNRGVSQPDLDGAMRFVADLFNSGALARFVDNFANTFRIDFQYSSDPVKDLRPDDLKIQVDGLNKRFIIDRADFILDSISARVYKNGVGPINVTRMSDGLTATARSNVAAAPQEMLCDTNSGQMIYQSGNYYTADDKLREWRRNAAGAVALSKRDDGQGDVNLPYNFPFPTNTCERPMTKIECFSGENPGMNIIAPPRNENPGLMRVLDAKRIESCIKEGPEPDPNDFTLSDRAVNIQNGSYILGRVPFQQKPGGPCIKAPFAQRPWNGPAAPCGVGRMLNTSLVNSNIGEQALKMQTNMDQTVPTSMGGPEYFNHGKNAQSGQYEHFNEKPAHPPFMTDYLYDNYGTNCSYRTKGGQFYSESSLHQDKPTTAPVAAYMDIPNSDLGEEYNGEAVSRLLNTSQIQLLNKNCGSYDNNNIPVSNVGRHPFILSGTGKDCKGAYNLAKEFNGDAPNPNDIKFWTTKAQGPIDESNPVEFKRYMDRRLFRTYNAARPLQYLLDDSVQPITACDSAAAQIPFWRKAVHQRPYERNVDEALSGREFDYKTYAYDMSSLYCRIARDTTDRNAACGVPKSRFGKTPIDVENYSRKTYLYNFRDGGV